MSLSRPQPGINLLVTLPDIPFSNLDSPTPFVHPNVRNRPPQVLPIGIGNDRKHECCPPKRGPVSTVP
jgi:hypothetical protein